MPLHRFATSLATLFLAGTLIKASHTNATPLAPTDATRAVSDVTQFLPADPDWQTLSITSIDVDGDGAPEPVGGEVGPHQELRLRVGLGTIVTTCFPAARPDAERVLSRLALRLRPDILRAADLDADGHDNLIVAELGAERVDWYSGPLAEATRPAGSFDLPGRLRLIETADIDRRDGLGDLLIAVETDQGSDRLVVFRSPLGAANAEPESLSLPSPITRLSWGRVADPDNPGVIDLWVEAGGQPWRVAGRWTLDASPTATAEPPRQPVLWLTGRDPSTWESSSTLGRPGGHEPQPRRATFVVNSLIDGSDGDPADGICEISPLDPSGICTLRAAVEQANATPGPDGIEFALPGAGPHELMVSGPDPIEITATVSIDATTQDGYAGSPIVELGFAGGGILPGLLVTGDDVLICGLSITGFPGEGVAISGDRAILEGNWIGLDPSGTATGNFRGIGSSGDNGRIGGSPPDTGNVISSNATGGIVLADEAEGNLMYGNRIGTDPDGLVAIPNGGAGVFVAGSSNEIGGPGIREGNLISGNASVGIWLAGSFNRVLSNVVGGDVTEANPLGNAFAGIFVADGADAQVIGGVPGSNVVVATVADGGGLGGSGIVVRGSDGTWIRGNQIGGAGDLGNELHGIHIERTGASIPRNGVIGSAGFLANVIIGNGFGGTGHGILLEGAEDHLVFGNRVGTGFFGLGSLGNSGDGIRLVESSDVIVGGTQLNQFNVIFNNEGNGIGIHDLDSSAGQQNTQENRLTRNLLRKNGALGIDLTLGGPVADGPTANDDDDTDFGPNRLQNFPVLDPATRVGGTTTLGGSLSAAPSTQYRIEFFDNPACDPSGFGEAHTFLGSLDVTTDGLGDVAFSFTTSSFVTFPTATATHLTTEDTSELSLCPSTLPDGDGFLGDRVWQDLDGDGLQALGEPGVAGVTVRLLDAATSAELAQTVTDADGIYRFVGAATGSYRIAVDPPGGSVFVTPNVGDDDADSDIVPATGMTEAFTYVAGTVDLSQDAGLDVPIFNDGFESGDTSRWSVVEPLQPKSSALHTSSR